MVTANRQKIVVRQAPAMATGMLSIVVLLVGDVDSSKDCCVAGAEFNRFPSQDIRCFAGQ
ncbi:hypothetical protein [Paraburkholderia nodosa]|uniref:hypothetical protein n=1 Tax=Paraburkholderia nodosa TaxID=392320 RepID=UPI0012B698D1|nr:hypothetical protein [Paraburkholderia nodosa]